MQPITNELIERILLSTIKDGGFSIDLKTGVHNFESGYFVAADNTEKTHSLTKGTTIRAVIKNFIVENWGLLKEANKVLGLWIFDGKIYLDISTLYASKTDSLTAARVANQLAIWDNKNKVEIKID